MLCLLFSAFYKSGTILIILKIWLILIMTPSDIIIFIDNFPISQMRKLIAKRMICPRPTYDFINKNI